MIDNFFLFLIKNPSFLFPSDHPRVCGEGDRGILKGSLIHPSVSTCR